MLLEFESIKQAVKHHDRYQVEIKLDYELQEGQQTRYKVETFIFSPYTLGVSENTYSRKNFYRDVQNYIRLKTPSMLLRDFTESKLSPLTTIAQISNQANWIHDSSATSQISIQFKLLSVMVNSAIRDHLLHIESNLEGMEPTEQLHLIIDSLVNAFLEETQSISQQYRDMYVNFNLPHVPAEVINGFRLTDESISILIEEGLIGLFEIIEPCARQWNQSEWLNMISKRAEEETQYRRDHGYSSILDDSGNNEAYLYRASVLKKYAASILFLNLETKADGTQLLHLGDAIAAGVAMIFATVIAFYSQARFGNFTLPLFIALVIGYMFKDRIKEISRRAVARRLHTFLSDRQVTIRTQDGVKLGYLKEKVGFVTEKELPRLVLQKRNRDQFSRLDNDGREENIVRHAKEIVLYADAFDRLFGNTVQISGINDILRYDIRAYLNKMGEPVQYRNYLEKGNLREVTCHKVYHINIVSRYRMSQPQKSKFHDRSQLVLDRSGIKRIERP